MGTWSRRTCWSPVGQESTSTSPFRQTRHLTHHRIPSSPTSRALGAIMAEDCSFFFKSDWWTAEDPSMVWTLISVATSRRWPLPEGESLTSAAGFQFQKVPQILRIALLISIRSSPRNSIRIWPDNTKVVDILYEISYVMAQANGYAWSTSKKSWPSTRCPSTPDDYSAPFILWFALQYTAFCQLTNFPDAVVLLPWPLNVSSYTFYDQCSASTALFDLSQWSGRMYSPPSWCCVNKTLCNA